MEPSGAVLEPARKRLMYCSLWHGTVWNRRGTIVEPSCLLRFPTRPAPSHRTNYNIIKSSANRNRRIAVENFDKGSVGAGLFLDGYLFQHIIFLFRSRINNKIKETTHRLLPANPNKHNVYFQLLLSATSVRFAHQNMLIDYSNHFKYLIRQKACMRTRF